MGRSYGSELSFTKKKIIVFGCYSTQVCNRYSIIVILNLDCDENASAESIPTILYNTIDIFKVS